MRKIRFRVWDTKYNKFAVPNMDNHDVYFYLSSILAELVPLKEYEGRFILQQFTGYSDKNGREVFEGDILKYKIYEGNMDSRDDFYGGIGEVKFENGTYFPRAYLLVCEDSWYNYEVFDLEVVGNVMENPGLLDKK
jgi:uncharacterized phage protein (TIGR01671 family)